MSRASLEEKDPSGCGWESSPGSLCCYLAGGKSEEGGRRELVELRGLRKGASETRD